jgi:hypothetical protein
MRDWTLEIFPPEKLIVKKSNHSQKNGTADAAAVKTFSRRKSRAMSKSRVTG